MGYNTKTCYTCGTVYDRGTGFSERSCPTCSMPKEKNETDTKIETLFRRIERLENQVNELNRVTAES